MTYEKIFADVKKAYSKADKNKLSNDFAFQFNITGEGEGIFYVAYRGGVLEIAPYDYVDRNATLFASGDDFIKLANAKFTLEEASEQGIVYVEGDYNLALELNKIACAKAPSKKPTASSPTKSTKKEAKAKETKAKENKVDAKASAPVIIEKPVTDDKIIGAQNAIKPILPKKDDLV